MKFDETINKILSERLSDVNIKQGKMKKLLGVKEDETLEDKFSNGKALAQALLKAVNDDKKEASGMLAYAANINPEKNILDDALKALKDL